jgi:hypothetical protein
MKDTKRALVPAKTGQHVVSSRASTVAAADDNLPREEQNEDQELVRRIEQLSADVGWLLLYVGVLGWFLPGVPGVPFLVAGAAIITPGGPKWLARRLGPKPPWIVRVSMRQIGRFLDDLDRRYPPRPKNSG